MANVLVVDDEDSSRSALKRYLELVPRWTVREAATAEDAIPIIESTPLDAILLDRRMPNRAGQLVDGGDQLVKWLHNRDLLGDICVVLMTGYGDFQSIRAALRMGVWNYLEKPISPSDVHRLLAPGIALKSCHRLRRQIIAAESAVSVIGSIESVVMRTLSPDLFRVIFSSTLKYGDIPHATKEDALRRFVNNIFAGKRFLYAGSRNAVKDLDPLLDDCGSLMAAGIVLNDANPFGLIVMESRQEDAFDLGWQDVLAYLADLIGLSLTIRSGREAERAAHDRELHSQRLLHRELRHRLSTSIGTLFQQVDSIMDDLSFDDARASTRAKALVIQKHAKTMISVIEELRNASASPTMNLQSCNLADLAGQVMRETEWKSKASNIWIKLEAPQQSVIVEGDLQSLEYCLNCIIWNAIESVLEQRTWALPGERTDAGDARTSKSTGTLGKPFVDDATDSDILIVVKGTGGVGEICVADRGIGFDAQISERLFTPLFTTKQRRGENSNDGIGLYTVKNMIEAMSGTIQAASKGPGTGAEFVVRLKLAHEGVARGSCSTG